MGTYVNPDNELFKNATNSKIYVDKTMMISEINQLVDTVDNYVCVSRPRRFGKSVAAAMLVAYYSKGCKSSDLFGRYRIGNEPGFDEHLNRHNVIYIDLKSFFRRGQDNSSIMQKVADTIIGELSEEFPNVSLSQHSDLAIAISDIYKATKEKFVFIIDEYDLLVREQVDKSQIDTYLGFLESLFKNNNLRSAFSLAYLTGILPIVRDQIQSKMNEFDEYTIINSRFLAPYIGITLSEAEELCRSHNLDFAECKRWYDGYQINGNEVFATKSVVQSIKDREFDSYWSNTGSYESIANYINLDFDGIVYDIQQMLAGKSVMVNVLSYLNTMTDFNYKDDIFTYLIHLGYLGYQRASKECFIPNYEVRLQWELAIKKASNFKPVADSISESEELLRRTINGDAEYVAQALDKAHRELCTPLRYNNESAFQVAMVMAYYTARNNYFIIQELPTGNGFADIALIPMEPGKSAIIIELKVNGSAGLAISQIKDRRYDTVLRHYRGKIIYAGINYDKVSKSHECRIEIINR